MPRADDVLANGAVGGYRVNRELRRRKRQIRPDIKIHGDIGDEDDEWTRTLPRAFCRLAVALISAVHCLPTKLSLDDVCHLEFDPFIIAPPGCANPSATGSVCKHTSVSPREESTAHKAGTSSSSGGPRQMTREPHLCSTQPAVCNASSLLEDKTQFIPKVFDGVEFFFYIKLTQPSLYGPTNPSLPVHLIHPKQDYF
ncbi:unnamed protein product [Pleuronectes platessa]|uniref:Uncharacterized protein n=1 Tax=Pleuronectes platessa TaxID=8262 RepID=A0A9N7YYL6_PLEPL|nr:unnamed protein product [Pleuronectes platessa]